MITMVDNIYELKIHIKISGALFKY
jgi:hypothetical protein